MWQTASDFLIFLGWVWQNTTILLVKIFLPVQYIFTFLKQFFIKAFATPVIPDTIWAFTVQIKGIFNTIPYFNELMSVAIIGITILMIVFILKTFLKT